MRRGGRPNRVTTRNKVTGSLMAITVIIVGTVNCFFAGPIDVEGRRNAIREAKGGRGGEEVSGTEGWRGRERAMDCGIEMSVQVMIRRRRGGHVRNEFHAC